MTKKAHLIVGITIALCALGMSASTVFAGNPGNCQQYDGTGGEVAYSCDGMPPIESVNASFSANPTTITQGQGSTLTWSGTIISSGGGTCYSGQFDTGGAVGGSVVVYPAVTTTYSITCAGSYVSVTRSATVTVNAAYTDVYAGGTVAATGIVGQAMTLEASVYNQGNATATNFPNSFQISGIGYVAAQTHTLGSGGGTGISASYTFPSIGYYSVRACADINTSGNGVLSETDEGNNCGAWQTITVNPSGSCYATPDGPSLAYGTGSHTMYMYNVPPAYSQAWFPTWSDVGGQDDIQWHYATALGNGTFSVTVNLASHSGYGPYSVHGYLGNGGSAQLFCDYANFTRLGQADLTASALSPGTATAGSAVTITGTISNGGTAASGVTTTSALRIYDSGGTLIQSAGYSTPSVSEGGSSAVSYSYTFPSAGVYTMNLCADWGGAVAEGNEGNNCGPTTGITVGNPPAPDLTASNLGPGSGVIASATTFQGRVNNAGNATATNIPNIFQICDGGCATLNTVIAGTTIGSVGAGANNSGVTGTYTFSSPGTYYYRMCADTNTSWAGANAESNESNNCDNWAGITIYAPDLTASVTAPGTVTSGAATTFTGRVYNTGSGSTGGGFSNRWEIDNDAAGAAYATIVDVIAAVPAGADNGTTATYTIPAGSGGTWFVRMCADMNAGGAGTIAEGNEGNNCTGWTSFTVAVPDLTAGATSYTANPASPYVIAGTPFTFNSTVSNVGNATATNFPNMFWIDSVALFAGQTHTLAGGGSAAISGSYTFNTPGTYNVQSCADYNTAWGTTISESNEGNNCGGWLGISVTPAAPTGFTASCNVNGTAINFSWNASAGSSFYYVRVSKLASESCPSGWQQPAWSTTTCTPNPDSWGSTSVTNYPITPGNMYSYGAHGALSNGAWGPYGGSVISCSGAADLTGSTAGNLSGTTGVPLTVSGTVTNAGNASAGAHSSVIQICGNGTDASCNTIQANAQVAVGALTASQSLPVSTQFTFPTAGTNGYTYRVCADNWSPTITEASDANNCSGWSNITISDPGLTASCSVSPTAQQLNQNVTWTASAGGGNGVYTYSWGGTSPLSGTGNPRTVSYSSAGTKTGSVTVTSGAQQTTVACSNSVVVSNPPATTLSSSPTIVTTGSASTLTWSSSGATSCTGTGFNTGGATSGSVSTGALNSTQNYQVSCTGPGGTTNDFETVTVIAPTANIVAQPTLVKSGSGTNLVWSATEVSSCTLSASPAGPSFTSTFSPVTPGQNTTAVTNITRQTDFTLSCTTLSGGNISGSVQVNVRFDSDEF